MLDDSRPGTYALLIRAARPVTLRVGALGTVDIRRGIHVYVGSAHGPGGLAARIRRHVARDKRVHWHVDHLTTRLPVIEVWWAPGERRLEHAWSDAVAALPGARVSVPRFGSSDCRCATHLWWFARGPGRPPWRDVRRLVLDERRGPGDAGVATP